MISTRQWVLLWSWNEAKPKIMYRELLIKPELICRLDMESSIAPAMPTRHCAEYSTRFSFKGSNHPHPDIQDHTVKEIFDIGSPWFQGSMFFHMVTDGWSNAMSSLLQSIGAASYPNLQEHPQADTVQNQQINGKSTGPWVMHSTVNFTFKQQSNKKTFFFVF